MSKFEELANELNIKIERDENNKLCGISKELAAIVGDVILEEDYETLLKRTWQEEKEIIKDRFYKLYPEI